MAKDINLTSTKWNDIIFEDKPKNYGAYEMRQSSSKRHIWAFLITAVLLVFVSLLPQILETVARLRPAPDNISTDTTLADLELMDETEKLDQVVQETAPPPPPLKSTIQFVAPEIVADEEIPDEERLKSQEELLASKADVSLFDVEGDDDAHGIDKAELESHREIAAEVVDNKVYDFVEQMPSFPGGDSELRKFLSSNVRYPEIARENEIQGTVVMRFTVDRDGSITNVTVLASPDNSLTKEATRLIGSMPNWIPGKQNGVAVRVNYNVPIVFKIQ